MRELNIRYKTGLYDIYGAYIKIFNNAAKNDLHAIHCTCPNENEIWLWGTEMDFETWWNIIIHENFHAVLWANDIDPDFHHPIMFMISKLIEKSDKNDKNK